jgi:hypothetical protein
MYVCMYVCMYVWYDCKETGFGLVTGFIRHLQFPVTIYRIVLLHILIVRNSLHMYWILSVCCPFTSPLVPASNGEISPSRVPEPQRHWPLIHSALTNSILLAPLNTLKSSPFWSFPSTANLKFRLSIPDFLLHLTSLPRVTSLYIFEMGEIEKHF